MHQAHAPSRLKAFLRPEPNPGLQDPDEFRTCDQRVRGPAEQSLAQLRLRPGAESIGGPLFDRTCNSRQEQIVAVKGVVRLCFSSLHSLSRNSTVPLIL